MTTASDLMTENPQTVAADDSWVAALDVMVELNVRHVPVVDRDGDLVGLVSQRDLLKASASVADLASPIRRELFSLRTIDRLMATGVETVAPDAPLREVGDLMLENKFGCVPVCEGERLVGIITEADFVRYVVDQLADE